MFLAETINEFAESKKDRDIEIIRNGLTIAYFERAKEEIGVTEIALLKLVGFSSRTLQRQRKTPQKRLTASQSEHILYLKDLFNQGAKYFESPEIMRLWLQEPSHAFGNQTPLSYCDTITGIKEVSNTINKLAHGMTA